MIFLQGHGVGASHCVKIFKKYGKASIAAVKENPYRLAADIHGIGFVTADNIARNLGIDPSSIIRAEEGTLYVLRKFMAEGNVYYPYEPLVDKTAELLGVEREIVTRAIANLFKQKRVILEDLNRPGDSFIPNNKAVYLAPFYTAEKNLAKKLLFLKRVKSFRPLSSPEKALAQVEKTADQACPHAAEASQGSPKQGAGDYRGREPAKRRLYVPFRAFQVPGIS